MSNDANKLVMRMKVESGGDIHNILTAARIVGEIAKNKAGLKKRLDEQLAKKGGPWQLYRHLNLLVDFARSLRDCKVVVDATVEGQR